MNAAERQRAVKELLVPVFCPRRTGLVRKTGSLSGSGCAHPGNFGYFPSLESSPPGGGTSPLDVSRETNRPPLWQRSVEKQIYFTPFGMRMVRQISPSFSSR